MHDHGRIIDYLHHSSLFAIYMSRKLFLVFLVHLAYVTSSVLYRAVNMHIDVTLCKVSLVNHGNCGRVDYHKIDQNAIHISYCML